MLNFLTSKPQNVVAVGDAFVSCETMKEALQTSKINIAKISTAFWGTPDKEEFTKRQLNIEKNGPKAETYAEGLDNLITDADVLINHFSPIPDTLIKKATRLKLILTCRGGLENIDVAAASKRNIPVVNVIRNAIPVAEFALGLILSVTRNIASSHRLLMDGKWEKNYPNSNSLTTLANLKVGLAGLGNVGIELATRLKALGVPMIAFDKYLSMDRLKRNGLENIELVSSLEELFRRADIVSMHLRLTPETKQLVDKRYFSIMKPTAYFINTSRGGLINQDDLIDVLSRHAIAGAALDVFNTEPIPANSALLNFDNVVLTPHIAGTTVDAIPKSPFLLINELNKIMTKGTTERIVNLDKINIG